MDIDQYCASLLKALAHPARLRILRTLHADGECCVCHLETRLGVRQAYLSQQLARLREAGLVEDRREGLNIFYSLAQGELAPLIELIQQSARSIARRNHVELKARRPPNAPVGGCACPRCQVDLQTQSAARVPTAG